MIAITEKAIKQVKDISEAEELGHYVIRAKVLGGGCAGFQLDLSFDDQIGEMDEVSETDGVKVVCDPMSFQYLDGATIDYEERMIGGGFKFNVPKSKGSCGCGSSFDF